MEPIELTSQQMELVDGSGSGTAMASGCLFECLIGGVFVCYLYLDF